MKATGNNFGFGQGGAGGSSPPIPPTNKLFTWYQITGTILTGTNFSTTSSGVNYTHNGDAGNLGTIAEFFSADRYLELNGVEQIKTEDFTRVATNTFRLNRDVHANDRIQLYTV